MAVIGISLICHIYKARVTIAVTAAIVREILSPIYPNPQYLFNDLNNLLILFNLI